MLGNNEVTLFTHTNSQTQPSIVMEKQFQEFPLLYQIGLVFIEKQTRAYRSHCIIVGILLSNSKMSSTNQAIQPKLLFFLISLCPILVFSEDKLKVTDI